MDLNNISIEKLVQYINIELQKDKAISVNKLCDKIGIKKSTLKSRMIRANYSYNIELRKYIKDNTTSNLTQAQQEVAITVHNTTSSITKVQHEAEVTEVNTENKVILLNKLESEKLNLLLNNLDGLLKLVEKKDATSSITISSNKTRVTSLRINEELYDLIKYRALRDNISISDIVNRSLMDYLNNYL